MKLLGFVFLATVGAAAVCWTLLPWLDPPSIQLILYVVPAAYGSIWDRARAGIVGGPLGGAFGGLALAGFAAVLDPIAAGLLQEYIYPLFMSIGAMIGAFVALAVYLTFVFLEAVRRKLIALMTPESAEPEPARLFLSAMTPEHPGHDDENGSPKMETPTVP